MKYASTVITITATDIPADIRSLLGDEQRANSLLDSLYALRYKHIAQGLFNTAEDIDRAIRNCLTYIKLRQLPSP